MEDIIKDIQSIDDELEATIEQYKRESSQLINDINLIDEAVKDLSDKSLEIYKDDKPIERIIGYLPIK